MVASNTAIFALAAMTGLAAASPVARNTSYAPVTTIQTVPNQDTGKLPDLPTDTASDVKTWLDKYQPQSKDAASEPKPSDWTSYPASGLCSKDHPCFSVNRVALGDFGGNFVLDPAKVIALLDKITSQPQITFTKDTTKQVMSGTRISTGDLNLDIIGAPSSLDSTLLAGEVFDLTKAHGLTAKENGVRGIASSTDSALPRLGLCVTPVHAEQGAVNFFCQGKELDGTVVINTASNAKRGRGRQGSSGSSGSSGNTGSSGGSGGNGGLIDDVCSIFFIPIIC